MNSLITSVTSAASEELFKYDIQIKIHMNKRIVTLLSILLFSLLFVYHLFEI